MQRGRRRVGGEVELQREGGVGGGSVTVDRGCCGTWVGLGVDVGMVPK